MRQDQLETPLLQLGLAQLADPLGKLLAKRIAVFLLLLGGRVEFGLLGGGEQQQGIKAQLAEGAGQLPQLAAALPVGQQNGQSQIVFTVVFGKQYRLLVDPGYIGQPFPVAGLPIVERLWLGNGGRDYAGLRHMASQHGQ